jgi:hypothetical protein
MSSMKLMPAAAWARVRADRDTVRNSQTRRSQPGPRKCTECNPDSAGAAGEAARMAEQVPSWARTAGAAAPTPPAVTWAWRVARGTKAAPVERHPPPCRRSPARRTPVQARRNDTRALFWHSAPEGLSLDLGLGRAAGATPRQGLPPRAPAPARLSEATQRDRRGAPHEVVRVVRR